MTAPQADTRAPQKPLRLWPGVVMVALQWLLWLGVHLVAPDATPYGIIGGALAGLVIFAWWMLLSRAPWSERLGVMVLIILSLFATFRVVHESIQNGAMGFMFVIYAIPVMSLGLVTGAVAGRGLSSRPRRALLVTAILLACGSLTLIRTNGVSGDAASDLRWRWTKTAEERFLAQLGSQPVVPRLAPATRGSKEPAIPPATEKPAPVRQLAAAAKAPTQPARTPASNALAAPPAPGAPPRVADWPGFRGPRRDGAIPHVRIAADWSATPPVELWRRSVGPGWSSFAVDHDLIYTQEQRGDDEVVTCYRASSGEPVWIHRDPARFWESNAGAGPRATPTLIDGRLYTFGATGIVNALNAEDGAVVWSRSAASDAKRKVPAWGFAGSPLVVGDLVIVAASGVLVAYDRATGGPRWLGPKGGGGYSSPHLLTVDGVAQVLLLNGAGVIGVAPSDGKLLWEHKWRGDGIVQPAVTADGDILLGTGSGLGADAGMGIRRIGVAQGVRGWTADERWTSAGLKPYFNDFVVHDGHAFGFDGSILSCIDLKDGKRKWKGGRYGHGQLLLLSDQNVLLVLSEGGELALVKAAPDQFTELARFKAVEGKTWNHPVLAGDVLLVRNDQEMAAFRLSLAGR